MDKWTGFTENSTALAEAMDAIKFMPKSFKVLSKESICPFSHFIGAVNTELLENVGLLSASEAIGELHKDISSGMLYIYVS